MCNTISVLVLRLEGVLQSWGEHSKWDYRDTAVFPTKSGIVGLLGCALGIPYGDQELVALGDRLSIAVRADRKGVLLRDYHTVSSTKLLNAMNKHRGKEGQVATIVTNRFYLQDAYFTVFLVGDRDLLLKLESALHRPVWPVFLGRKSCVPSRPVFDGTVNEFESIGTAFKTVPSPDRRDKTILFEVDKDLASGLNGSVLCRNDVLLDTRGIVRSYGSRFVVRGVLTD